MEREIDYFLDGEYENMDENMCVTDREECIVL